MKTALIIVIGSLVSFLTLLMVALALKSAKPEWFGGGAADPQKAVAMTPKGAAPDTLHAAPPGDSAHTAQVLPKDSTKTRGDSLLVAQLSTKAHMLESQVDSLKRQLQGAATKADTTVQQDWKSTAKLIDSMSAEEACKILKEMNDTDVKHVLGKVKKRQAGKILAALDPIRAAKLLR
jgi:flagellar motility protein MotE (MotC chaperone)